jgi:WhiB family redox-sensing transcriptional regulator
MTLLDLPDVELEKPHLVRLSELLAVERSVADHGLDTMVAAESESELESEPVEVEAPAASTFARCADGTGTLTHLFFSDDEFYIARAKAICGKCGLAPTCLAGALDRAESFGVWGGELVVDGVVVKVKRGRGRPPKTPRPPLVVDEVPLPPHLVA